MTPNDIKGLALGMKPAILVYMGNGAVNWRELAGAVGWGALLVYQLFH